MATPPPIDLSAALVLAPPPLADWLVILPVALMIGLGAVLMMVRKSVRLHGTIAIAGLALLVAVDAGLLWRVAVHGPVTMVMGRWLPPFGIAFTADLFGATMALAAAIVALSGAIFALRDIDASGRRYGFYPFLMLLMAGVSGAFLTGDIFNLYVWFEVLLISSFGLLILGSQPEQIDGALKYAVLNLIATTLFLIAVGYLYAVFGTLNMADIAGRAVGLRETGPLTTLTGLFILAFAMKAAAFPVNFWLPASYHTPRIVVSALFGGLLTKVGIYALMRVTVMLFPVEREALSIVIATIAILTMLIGALGALAQSDIRKLVGYLVIAGIGNMLAGVAVGTPGAISGAILYAVHSMVTMTALYIVAGEIGRLGGSWSLVRLGGLFQRAPWFAGASFVLFLAAAGLPPISGLWPKVVLLKSALDIGAWWLAAAILVSAFLITLALARVFLFAYWRPAPDAASEDVAPADWRIAVPLAVLTALTVYFGLMPEALLGLSQDAATGLADPAAYIKSVFPLGGCAMITFVLSLVFAIIWVAVSGSATLHNLALGFALATLALWIVRHDTGARGYWGRLSRIFSLLVLFFKELALSAWKVATLVMRRDMDLKPGIFAYPLTVDRDFEITLLANLITLTPGTLSVDVSEDRKTLFVHAIDCSDVEATKRDIADGFERKIMEAFPMTGLILSWSVWVALIVLAVALLLTVRRVIQGPTLADRVVALDMLTGIVIGFIALIAIRTGFTLYIDIAISLGLVGFLATVAFARFILSRDRRERPGPAEVAQALLATPAARKKTVTKRKTGTGPAVRRKRDK